MKIQGINENSTIIYFSKLIDINVSKKIRSVFIILHKEEGVIDLVCSYTSILVVYDISIFDEESFEKYIKEKIKNTQEDIEDEKYELLEIPVYYGEEVGLDLKELSNSLKLSIDEIINIHSSRIYDVFAIGFLPAFAYLGEVDEKLFTNRKTNPRKIVKKSSVAIANTQTAIYPKDSPGGWNIIGKSPIDLFDKNSKELSLITYTKKVRFKPISKNEFLHLGGEL